jgi:hypothetical protein
VIVPAVTTISTRSATLGDSGLASLIEIGASAVMVWELTRHGQTVTDWACESSASHNPRSRPQRY